LAVDTSRPRLDLLAFALAVALVVGPAIGFVAERNGAAAIMSAMCLAGLVAGRIVGVPGRVLLPVAFGFMVAIWMIWVDSPASPRKTSALAHVFGGTLAGWALVEVLRHRLRGWLSVALLALSVVIALTVVWKRNSAEDILLGTAGGLVGITFGGVVAFWRRGGLARQA
jgi:hypothetical protein